MDMPYPPSARNSTPRLSFFRSRRILLLLIPASALCLWGLRAVLTPTGGGQALDGTLLRIGLRLPPPHLDPTQSSAAVLSEVVLYNVLEPLVEIGADQTVRPLLADRWEKNAQRTLWRFHLRDGVSFHNGRPLTPHDVLLSFQNLMDPAQNRVEGAFFRSLLTDIRLDGRWISFHLNAPSRRFLPKLGSAAAVILENGRIEDPSRPVGTGPYRLAAPYIAGEDITLQRFDPYWAPRNGEFETVVLHFLPPESLEAYENLRNGRLDAIVHFPPGSGLDKLGRENRFKILKGPSSGEIMLIMNHRNPLFQRKEARQALGRALDRADIVHRCSYGTARAAFLPLPPFALLRPYRRPDPDPFDPKSARRLWQSLPQELREASYTLSLPPTEYAQSCGLLIAGALKDTLGLRLRLQSMDWARWLEEVYHKARYDLTIVAHAEPLDLDMFDRAPEVFYFGYHNPRLQALFRRYDQGSPAEAAAAQAAILEQITEDAAQIMLYEWPFIIVHRRELGGFFDHQFLPALALKYVHRVSAADGPTILKGMGVSGGASSTSATGG